VAKYNSKVSVLKLSPSSSTAAYVDISAFITGISGLPGEREMNDVTALGDNGRKHIPALDNVSVDLEGVWDSTAAGLADQILGSMRTYTSKALPFKFFPAGVTSTYRKYNGTWWLATYDVASKVGDAIMWKAHFVVDGAITIGTSTGA